MCGIAGIVRWGRWPTYAEIDAMTAAVAHRGPDGSGTLLRGPVALGHRRLSIIDVKDGRQPMGNEDGSVQVTFNGEIYNHAELRRELEGSGHRFRTRCDTEVIAHGYEEWGDACVERFRGMFAFGLADFLRRKVLLARDPFGIKPLYIRRSADYLGFASELPALRCIDDAVPRGRLQSVEFFLRYGYIPAPDTIYENISKLLPGHRLALTFDGEVDQPQRYWRMPYAPGREHATDEREWDERFATVLRDSVRAHLVADVPFGVFLSGGVDSTLVAAQMSELLERPVTAFSIGFDDEETSELKHARHAAEELGVDLRHEIVREDVSTLLPALIGRYGEPYADSSALPTWHLCRLARETVPMVLSGDGGDEFFAGYGRYEVFAHRSRSSLLRRVIRRSRDWPVAARVLATHGLRSAGPLDAWLAIMNYVPDRARRMLWRPQFHHLLATPNPRFADAAREAPDAGRDPVAFAQHIDLATYLPDDVLTKVDIASMCHGLEVRTPLVDVEVARFVSTLPLTERIGGSGGPSPVLKRLPKRSLGRRFSQEFVHRPKQGFGIPRDKWMKRGTPMRRALDEMIGDPSSPLRPYFRPEALRRLTRVHDATCLFSTPLWPMLVLGLWLRQNPAVGFDSADCGAFG